MGFISLSKDLLYSLVSMTNSQALFSRFIDVKSFLPKITVARYGFGADIPLDEAERILASIPSLASKPWTHFWRDKGLEFERAENYRAACMSYIMGVFPKDDRPWKDEINELKRASFLKWNQQQGLSFNPRRVRTSAGDVFYYLSPPSNLGEKAPVTIFINGLEGSAEEIAFSLQQYLHEGPGYAVLSVPGSADYEKPMTARSDQVLREVIDDIVSLPWVDEREIGLVGFSMGAFWTLITTKMDNRIKFAICNGIPLKRTLSSGQGVGLNPIIAEALIRIFGVSHPLLLLPIVREMSRRAESLVNLPSGPILAMNGDKDTIVDPRDTIDLGSLPGNRLILIKNDDHCGIFHYRRMIEIIVKWTRRNLSLQRQQRLKTSSNPL